MNNRDVLEGVLKAALKEIAEGREGELATAQRQIESWKREFEELGKWLERERQSRQWADASYFKVKEESYTLQRRVYELEQENKALRELADASSVQIALLERQVARLHKEAT